MLSHFITAPLFILKSFMMFYFVYRKLIFSKTGDNMKTLDAFGLEVISRLAKQTFPQKGSLDEEIKKVESLNEIQPNTVYEVGDILNRDDLPSGCVLLCIEGGTTSQGA